MTDQEKPRLLYLRWLIDDLPDFIAGILRSQVDCLSRFFDVTVVTESCDYGEMCERYRPDLVVFESGVNAGPRAVTNTSAHPDIPKLGLIYSDAYCVSRTAAISDMARWGVESLFTVSVSMGEYTPDIADNLFVWPNFIEPEIFHDYGETKSIPVLLTGSQATNYPWRNRISRVVAQAFPALTMPHGGWFRQAGAARMVHGERYARMINASMVAPTCGTIAREVVRKHFEIPAARSCLVTERVPSIEAAGFVDMENCVFVDEHDVIDKLDHLLADPERLRSITDAGYELVHRRHTAAARDQIFEWYTLRTARRPGERIVQRSPFGPLELVPDTGAGNIHVINDTLDRQLLRQARENLRAGRYGAAEHQFLRCLNYHYMPEAALGLVAGHLLQGSPDAALRRLTEMIELTLLSHRALDPDPVEWAYYIRALVCAGRLGEAGTRARQYPDLHHPELDRIRSVVGRLTDSMVPRQRSSDGSDRRRSVHPLTGANDDDWLDDLLAMIRACGQPRLSDRLRSRSDTTETGGAVPAHTRVGDAVTVKGHRLGRKIARRYRRELGRFTRTRELDDAPRLVQQHAGRDDVASVVVLGSIPPQQADALADGVRANPNRATVFSIVDTAGGPATIKVGPGVAVAAEQTLAATRKMYGIEAFDLVILGETPHVAAEFAVEVTAATTVVITALNRLEGQRWARTLASDHGYTLLAHDPGAGAGHAVFSRIGRSATPAADHG